MVRALALLLVVASAAVVTVAGRAAPAAAGKPQTVIVGSDVAFAAAAARLRVSGGRIVLRSRLYRRLVIGPRSGRELRIVGSRGTRVERILLWRTRRVSLGRLTIGPIDGDARIELQQARDIDLHDLVITAKGSGRRSASIFIAHARHVTIRRSVFTHCGDFSPDFVNCVTLNRGAHNVVIEDNRFHDCRGCDFIHGRFGSRLTIRRNHFDRALPCHMGRYRCGHNDLVQLFAGRWLLVEGNRFGVYRDGGAQLYLTDDLDHATIVNNLFVGTDPRVPGYQARMAIVIGANESKRLPYYARIVNNTILTGYRRRDGYEGSIRMSSKYGGVRRWKRPIVANNVIALLETSWRVCAASQRFLRNVVMEGTDCAAEAYPGPVDLDRLGRPRPDSVLIGLADRHYAPPVDITGRRRDAEPDIGAYEYRAGQ